MPVQEGCGATHAPAEQTEPKQHGAPGPQVPPRGEQTPQVPSLVQEPAQQGSEPEHAAPRGTQAQVPLEHRRPPQQGTLPLQVSPEARQISPPQCPLAQISPLQHGRLSSQAFPS